MRILVDEFPFSPEHCIFMKRLNGKYICSIGQRLYKCEAECDLYDRVFKHKCWKRSWKMIDKITLAITGGTVVVSVGVLAFFDYRKKKISEIAKNLSVDIPEKVLNRAIDIAVTDACNREIESGKRIAIAAVKDEIKSQVKKTVDKETDKLKPKVEDEINRQIKRIDIDDVRKDVISEAKDKVARKFENDLDDILDKHNEELDKITRIYSSIADKLEGN